MRRRIEGGYWLIELSGLLLYFQECPHGRIPRWSVIYNSISRQKTSVSSLTLFFSISSSILKHVLIAIQVGKQAACAGPSKNQPKVQTGCFPQQIACMWWLSLPTLYLLFSQHEMDDRCYFAFVQRPGDVLVCCSGVPNNYNMRGKG